MDKTKQPETADAVLLELALDALAGCDSMLSLYFYRAGDELFRRPGLPDKEQVGDAIAKARRVLNACQYYEKKMQAHEARHQERGGDEGNR